VTSQPVHRRAALGIRTRMMVLVGVAAMLSTAILGWIALASLDGLMQQLLAGRRSLVQTTAEQVEHAVRDAVEILSSVSAAPRFAPADGDALPEAQALHTARLRARVFDLVALVTLDGSVIAADGAAADSASAAVAAMPEVGAAARLGRPTVSAARNIAGKQAHAFFVPVRDGTGQFAAAVAGVRAARDTGWTRLLEVGPPGRTITVDLIDADGTIVASSVARRAGATTDRRDLLREVHWLHDVYTADVPDRTGRAGEVIAYAPLSLVPWAVVIRQSDREVFAAVYDGRRRLLQWGPIMLALGLLFTWGAAESVLAPLAVLTRAAERIAAGDLRRPIPRLPADEIGRLGTAFETMRIQLAASMDDITRTNEQLEARVAARTSELQATHRELQARDELRGKLLRKVITAQEEERKRLARELHDETCQKLAALGIRLDTALRADSPYDMRGRLGDARALATQTLDDVHRVIFDLRPSVLDDLGLLAAIRWYAHRQLEPCGIAVRCDFTDLALRLPAEIETALFRSVQEAVNNIARHSRAENALIEIDHGAEGLHIEIEDDGVGFDLNELTSTVDSGRGLGLTGLRERIELLGGTSTIDSSPGDGTRVRFTVPLAVIDR
jgi:signal transduction histidine kinase